MQKRKAKSTSPKHPRSGAPARKSRVHFIKTDRGLFPLSELQKYANEAASQQLPEDDVAWLRENGLVPLPFNVNRLLDLQDNCTFFDSCARQIANDVVAQGYDLVPVEEGKEDKAKRKEIADLFDDPNKEDETLLDIIKKNIIDWGVVGWFGIEVSRAGAAADHRVNGLFHMPAHTIRVHRERQKYCQVRDTRKRWFKRFGADIVVSAETGLEHKSSKHEANELIFYGEYYAKNTYYGRPNILPAVGAVFGLIGVRDYNLEFFENYGIPAALVTLEGEWEEGSAKLISDFIDNEIKGTENAHRTVVLELTEGANITWKPLVVEVKEGHFAVYYKSLRDEVLSSYKMPPYRIGIAEVGSLGGTTASTADRIYVESIVQPLQLMVARIINTKIIQEGLQCDTYKLVFKKIDTRDWKALVERWKVLFGMAVITPGWIAEQLALDTKDMVHADEYFVSNQFAPLAEAGLNPATMTEDDIKDAVDKLVAKAKANIKEKTNG